MALIEHETEIRTGRRDADGLIRLAIFMDEMLTLTLEGHGERAPTLLLTFEQARRLQDALAQLIPRVDEASREEKKKMEAWQGDDRRRLVS